MSISSKVSRRGTNWIAGLSARTAVSGNGGYREGAAEELLALNTCVWRGLEFSGFGAGAQALFAPNLPPSYRVKRERTSWTGRAYAYRWHGGDLTVDLRTTLPGPLFSTSGRVIRLRAISGSEWRTFEDLAGKATTVDSHGSTAVGGARLFLVDAQPQPLVVAASCGVRAIRVVTHTYYEFEFERPGARLLVVPLLDPEDAPHAPEFQRLWLELAARPPLEADESFVESEGRLAIRTRFPGARGGAHPALHGPAARARRTGRAAHRDHPAEDLVRALRARRGRRHHRHRVDGLVAGAHARPAEMADATSATKPAASASATAAIPDELAYAGDANWQPGTTMDQLLALRTWAPLVECAPAAVRERLIAQLAPPTAQELGDGVEIIREPLSGLAWGRWRQMWDHTGDACYDIDWYNGLGLSGLARAVECGIPAISEPARATARGSRPARAALLNYFKVFSDWALCTAWSDPRGWLWNADCLHNGLEGILAEGRLRAAEGDHAGAAWARFLAARHAIGLRASLEVPAWVESLQGAQPAASGRHHVARMVTWSGKPAADAAPAEATGVQGLVSWREITYCTTATRNPYILAGMNPEWNALLAHHTTPHWRSALLASLQHEPDRYRDWITFYIGQDWKERRAKGDQEARVQAAVFYSLAPEIAFRRLACGEDGAAILARFGTELNLAEQILLRAGFALSASSGSARISSAEARARLA